MAALMALTGVALGQLEEGWVGEGRRAGIRSRSSAVTGGSRQGPVPILLAVHICLLHILSSTVTSLDLSSHLRRTVLTL